MKPRWTLRLDSRSFGDAKTVCQGDQIASVIEAIAAARTDLVWYASDVAAVGGNVAWSHDGVPHRLGTSADVIRMTSVVSQFQSGVFSAVPEALSIDPRFRSGGVWTEDEEMADLADAVVEVRAFDTTYVSIDTSEPDIFDATSKRWHAG